MPLPEQDPFPFSAPDSFLLRFVAEEAEFAIVRADADCVIRYVNAAVVRLFGAPAERLIGQSCCRIYLCADHCCAGCPAEIARGGGRPSALQIMPEGAAGSVLHLQSYPVDEGESGFFVVGENITPYYRTEQALRDEAAEARRCTAHVENIIRSVRDGLVVADRQGRILLLNPSAERFFGIRQPSFLHLSLRECIHDRKLLKLFLQAIERDGHHRFEVQGEKGSVWSVDASPLSDGDGPGDKIFLLRDITRERELDRLKSEFISTAAHELRTPLTAITGFSELILTDAATPDHIREYADYIFRKAESLERIISDLLDTSRIEAGQGIQLARESCDFIALIRETVLPYGCGNGRHVLWLELPAGPIELRIDRGKMVQVLENLLSNAVKYSPGGGNIRVTLCLVPGACQVAVEDQGIGMTQEQVPRAFERFWRGDSSNTAISGTGLGLSIAKYIVEAHGGHIWLESRKKKGTTVFFILPLPPGEEGCLAGHKGADSAGASPLPLLDYINRPEPGREFAEPSTP